MLKSFAVQESVEKSVVAFGNGSIVYTPKKWIGKKVTVILEESSLDIKQQSLEILKPFFNLIQGVFLFGSHARNEQTADSDIDLLIISSKPFSLPKTDGFDFLIKTKEQFIYELKKDYTAFLPSILNESKPIFNESLLNELKKTKSNPDFSKFLDETLTAFKNIDLLLKADKKINSSKFDSFASVYSLTLRLKTLILIQCFLTDKPFSNKKLFELLETVFSSKKAFEFLKVFNSEKNEKGKAYLAEISVPEVEKLFELVKKEFLKTEAMI